jgi:hypothetical protein
MGGIGHTPDGRPILTGTYVLPPIDDEHGEMSQMDPNGQSKTPKQTASRGLSAVRRISRDRFKTLNSFVDVTMKDLTSSEALVWLTLFRDVRDGLAKVSQAYIAQRTGLRQATVSVAIKGLINRDLVVVVRQGGFRKGISTYRIRGSV